MDHAHEIARRRTFAIISHPDAGKTTLTEKLLLYGGALHMAGAVKSRKATRHAISDWMSIEQERGISITSSVLQFDHEGYRLNLLDTPGHADFSEDTYRTLAAVDGAVMLIDVAKGVEDRTKRLFEVCRLRNMPIITFVNKMDRPGRDPIDLMDEVQKLLKIGVVPLNWPIGQGSEFIGVLDRLTMNVHVYEKVDAGAAVATEKIAPLHSDEAKRLLGDRWAEVNESAELIEAAGDPWSVEAFLKGQVTPFFFGSAMSNFGVAPLLRAIEALMPKPLPRETVQGERRPEDADFAAFVFKIQANMNPKHRDRIAFMRVVSGKFERGMEVRLARTGKTLRMNKPHTFLAAERSIVEEAVPGDIVGLYDPGELRIGDTLSTGAPVVFQGIPRFAPEFFARVRLKDPMRRKQLQDGLMQLSQEGTVQLFFREGLGAADPYLGAVGMLQFEVLKVRLEQEYNVKVELETSRYTAARWIGGAASGRDWLDGRSDFAVVTDRDGRPVVLAETGWSLQYATQEAKGLILYDVSPLGGPES